ncbi:MAG: hypothetical protein KC478_16940 [Bacteriovoracaceae bacterium]|nr:hypothetical protein [Bacteriovoracaceae bacterium]
MKLFALLLLAFNPAFGAWIEGLDPDEIKDAEYCTKRLFNLTYKQINSIPNSRSDLYKGVSLDKKMFHNTIEDMYGDYFSMKGSILISATIRHDGHALIKDSVVSNMTFTGDVSRIDFTGSCLVNVRFPKETSWRTKRKIKKQALYYKHLEYKHEWEPRD